MASRITTLAIIALMAMVGLTGSSATSDGTASHAEDCVPEHIEGVGPACWRDGAMEVFDSAGDSLGLSHGPDLVAPGDVFLGDTAGPYGGDGTAGVGRYPSCVTDAQEGYFAHVIYAVAADDADNYASRANTIRDLVKQANDVFNDAAAVHGATADLRVLCDEDGIIVEHAVLPTSRNSDSFSTITSDLRAQGFTDGRVKYWVWYDDGVSANYAGQGHIHYDDRPIDDNANNGVGTADFAITYGYYSTRVMLHELGHNIGAVQPSAPHTTGGFHCTDGLDIMCYRDSGPYADQYTSSICATQVWDCNQDDYFNVNPDPDSYLATHWNIGHPRHRFVDLHLPTLIRTLDCPPRALTGEAACTVMATSDDAQGLRFEVDWGDGQTTSSPAGPTHPVGTPLEISHVYGPGTHTVSVVAHDDGGGVSAPRQTDIQVADAFPPDMGLQCPDAFSVDKAMTCIVDVDDFERDIADIVVSWGDGAETVVASNTSMPFGADVQHTYSAATTYAVTATATQADGLTGSAVTNVLIHTNRAPATPQVDCHVAYTRHVECTAESSDPDGDPLSYTYIWGDGSQSVTDGTAGHTYAQKGTYSVQVRAQDDRGASSPWQYHFMDVEPPTLTLRWPIEKHVYVGCSDVGDAVTIDVTSPSAGPQPTTTSPPPIDPVDIQIEPFATQVREGCLKVKVEDADSDVTYLEIIAPASCGYGDRIWYYAPTTYTTVQYPLCNEVALGEIQVTAYDEAGNTVTKNSDRVLAVPGQFDLNEPIYEALRIYGTVCDRTVGNMDWTAVEDAVQKAFPGSDVDIARMCDITYYGTT